MDVTYLSVAAICCANSGRRAAGSPKKGSISVAEAAQAAEKANDGKAVEVEIEDCEFEVQVVSGGELYEVEISPDGKVIEIEQSDEDDEDDDDECEQEGENEGENQGC